MSDFEQLFAEQGEHDLVDALVSDFIKSTIPSSRSSLVSLPDFEKPAEKLDKIYSSDFLAPSPQFSYAPSPNLLLSPFILQYFLVI